MRVEKRDKMGMLVKECSEGWDGGCMSSCLLFAVMAVVVAVVAVVGAVVAVVGAVVAGCFVPVWHPKESL